MKHDGDQGFPDPYATMTSEDWADFDKHAEAEHKKMSAEPNTDKSSFLPQNPNPPF